MRFNGRPAFGHLLGAVLAPILWVAIVANGCASAEALTEATATSLLQQFVNQRSDSSIAKGFSLVDYSPIASLLGKRTFTDYKQGDLKEPANVAILRRLLKGGFVKQNIELIPYANPTGTYENAGETGFHPLTLSMQQGSPSVGGSFHHFWKGVYVLVTCDGSVSGKMSLDGSLNLEFKGVTASMVWVDDRPGVPHMGSQDAMNNNCQTPNNGNYRIRQSDSQTQLDGNVNGYPENLHGNNSPEALKVASYTYALSQQFLGSAVPDVTRVKVGQIRIDSVSNLLLGETDTSAEGQFKWHVDLNELGQVFLGKKKLENNGRAVFRKQPDGNWTCVAAQ